MEFRARALSTLGGVNRIGIFIGPFIGAGVMQFAGISGAYWVGVAGHGGRGRAGRDHPGPAGSGRRLPVLPDPAPTLRGRGRLACRGVPDGRRRNPAAVSALRASRQVVIPLWADHLGLDASHASLMYGLSGAIDMLVFYPAGKVMDRRGRLWVAMPSTLIMGTALLLIPLTGGFTGLLLAALLIGFGNGISSGLVMTLGADFSPDHGPRAVPGPVAVHRRRRVHGRPRAALRSDRRGLPRRRRDGHRRTGVRSGSRVRRRPSQAEAPPELLTSGYVTRAGHGRFERNS